MALVVGCEAGGGTTNPGDPDAQVAPPMPDADPPGCQSVDECTDPAAPLCAPDGACVACLSNADCADVAAPTCDGETRTCRGCIVDDDCTSHVCNPDNGECLPAELIYYVDDDADCLAGDGSLAQPFCTIGEANDAAAIAHREVIHVFPGSYDMPPVPDLPMGNPTYHGDPAAFLREQPSGACFSLAAPIDIVVQGFRMENCSTGILSDLPSGNIIWFSPTIIGGDKGAHCIMGDCRLDGARIEGTSQAVRCEFGAVCNVRRSEITFNTGVAILALDESAVVIDETRIADIGYSGILAVDSAMTLRDSVVEHTGLETMEHGVRCHGATCVIQRSRIRSSTGAGIYVTSPDFVIENNAIVENGTIIAGQAVNGGVVIDVITAAQRFTNNTIYGNKAGTGEVAGIRCLAGTTVANSIVWGNGDGLQANDGCVVTSSAIDQDKDPLFSNFRMDPMITNTTPGLIDEHLLPGSPCIDRANSGAAVDDIDGQPREGAPDVGADERI